jgi:hypothetical protein
LKFTLSLCFSTTLLYVKKEDRNVSLSTPRLNRRGLPRSVNPILKTFVISDNREDQLRMLKNITKILNEHFGICACGVRLKNKKRKFVSGRGQYWLMAQYINPNRGTPYITIWTITENDRNLSSYQILNLFLHEYVHHYDMKKLRIDIPHDSGFWKRLKYLRKIFFKQ